MLVLRCVAAGMGRGTLAVLLTLALLAGAGAGLDRSVVQVFNMVQAEVSLQCRGWGPSLAFGHCDTSRMSIDSSSADRVRPPRHDVLQRLRALVRPRQHRPAPRGQPGPVLRGARRLLRPRHGGRGVPGGAQVGPRWYPEGQQVTASCCRCRTRCWPPTPGPAARTARASCVTTAGGCRRGAGDRRGAGGH